MSTSTTNSPIIPEWRRKRSNSSSFSDSPILSKRQKLDYFYVLASESSLSEDERSESVDSIQDKETDYCRDTSDTDTKSEQSSDSDGDYDIKVEYELVTSSDTEENPFASGSSSGVDDALIAAGAVATIVNDSADMDLWVTEGDDDSDSVSSFIESVRQSTCKKCKIRETVSRFPLCSHCHQARKNCNPPRPKHKKSRTTSVTTDRLSACLTVLSQDSGLGSSQEQMTNVNSSQELQTLAWDKVVVPENLIKSTVTSKSGDSSEKPKCLDQDIINWLTATKEMCIMCHENPKNGIFVHAMSGHLCCCYSCAVKSWTKTKRCAMCNLKAKNVIKAFIG